MKRKPPIGDRSPAQRAATLRAYAARALQHADYFDNVRGTPADADACRAFLEDPGAHAMLQRLEFEAELFEAIEQFKAQVARAVRWRDLRQVTPQSEYGATPDPAYALVQSFVHELATAKI